MRITGGDIEKLAMLFVFAPVAWLLPERFWIAVCRLVARVTGALMPGRRRAFAATMPAFIRALTGRTADGLMVDVVAGWHREMIEVLRCYRPDSWHPKARLIGAEHLSDALQDGRGAILWVADFESASLITKVALANAGYRTCQLSRPDHGFSPSPFGIRFLNPIRTSVEDRYIAERITILPGQTSHSLRTLRQRLEQGRLVSITVLDRASHTMAVPFFDSEVQLPTGPITLARSTGAALLPVFTLHTGTSRFEVVVEPPLRVSSDRVYDATFAQYARLLESYVKRSPTAYRAWQYDRG